MKEIKALIWDWNGTLLDDMDLCVQTINVLLARRNLALMNPERYRSLFSFPVKDYYENIGFNFQKEPYDEVAMEFINLYLSLLGDARLFAEVEETLQFFQTRKVKQTILSAMEHENLVASVKQKGIASYFPLMLGTDDHFAHGKAYQAGKIMNILGVPPSNTLLIGDTLHDKEVADTVGCHCVLVSQGHQSHERLLTAGCPVVSSLADVRNFFD